MKENTFQSVTETLRSGPPASLGPDRRAGALPEANVRAAVRDAVAAGAIPAARSQTVLALLLLWHDHLDAAHDIVQADGSADASFIHALMHRREPDYPNSKYWWRRTGSHPAFAGIAEDLRHLLKSKGREDRLGQLLPDGVWRPDAVVDACDAVAGHAAEDDDVDLLREVQRIEFRRLLDHLRAS